MIRLVTADHPDVVALQEVPPWALARLEEWSGMRAIGAVAMPQVLGPLSRPITAIDPVLFRSGFTGQANAVLVARRIGVVTAGVLPVNPRSFRRETARELRLGWPARLGWARNRRVCQILQLDDGGRTLVFANIHATAYGDRRLARAELARAAAALPDGPACVLAGDFNVRGFAPAGLSAPLPRIDQIVVRGLEFERPPAAWPPERRRIDGRLLSDHAPVEAVVA